MSPETFLDSFTTHLKNTLARSISIAASLEHETVTPTHLLFALCEESGSVGAEILYRVKIESKVVLKSLESIPKLKDTEKKGGTKTSVLPNLDKQSKKILERAMLLAYQKSHNFIGTEHLLLSILEQKNKNVHFIMEKLRVDLDQIRTELESVLESSTRFPNVEEMSQALEEFQNLNSLDSAAMLPIPSPGIKEKKNKNKKRPGAIELFSAHLTEPGHLKKLDPLVGREAELERLVHILSRRNKNNPLLIGETGVGKTAIVEGLAKKIIEGHVPDVLKRTKIYSLDLTLLISGTIYRGEFESRLKHVIDEAARTKNIILFIDEVHNIMGAGSNSGTMDAANILKPALARGELRCIGATTVDEFKKHISTDPALQRRFQSIFVTEPSIEQTKDILNGIKKQYETFHNTRITKEAIDACVEMSVKFNHETFLPDKAIDLLDEASASIYSQRKSTDLSKKIIEIENKLEKCLQDKDNAIIEEKFDEALKLKKLESQLKQKLKNANRENNEQQKPKAKKVTRADIGRIVHLRYGVPLDYLLQSEWERIKDLPDKLKKYIIGQDEAILKFSSNLEQAHLRLGKANQPILSALLVGPSGVGKTAFAKALAQELYQDEKALVKLDMSEFSESHGISKILGSPAGYVGHKDRNRFTEELKRRPYTVALFDEFDKAHPDVQRLLLQILDEGELTDSQGQKISFRHSIVILTSNIGAELYRSQGIGFGNTDSGHERTNLHSSVHSKLKESLGSALLSRIETVIPFNSLKKEDVQKIIQKQIDDMNSTLLQMGKFAITATKDALAELANRGYEEDSGVRNLNAVVRQTMHDTLMQTMRKKNPKKKYILKKKADTFNLV